MKKKLVNFAEKHKWTQYTLGFLPFCLVIIFGAFYIYDLLSVYTVIVVNDSIVQKNMDAGYVQEIVGYTDSGDIQVSGTNNFFCNVANDGVIYSVSILDKDFYMITNGDKSFYQAGDDFVKSTEYTDTSIKVTTLDGKELEYHKGDMLYQVFKDEKGFELLFGGNYSYHTDSIKGLVQIDDNSYEYTKQYTANISDNEMLYCSVLPTSGIYFDYSNQTLICNINDDFAKNFVIGSKLVVVILSTVSLTVLLFACYKTKVLSVLGASKKFIIFNIIGVAILGVLCLITYMLLSCSYNDMSTFVAYAVNSSIYC